MPMAGMMPIQSQQSGTQQQQQQQQQSQHQSGTQPQQLQQGGASIGPQQTSEPNAQGVKTFSIRM